jgi:hypothetical protein
LTSLIYAAPVGAKTVATGLVGQRALFRTPRCTPIRLDILTRSFRDDQPPRSMHPSR